MKNNPTPDEAVIRDFLMNNLEIIESDLTIIRKEFPLESSFGAGGRIDILAKDKFGVFVIIEIKKSDKTARQALHELQKYMVLFKTNHGLAADKCRCILLSTEWHELLVPFSEFSRNVDYQIDGYKLILNEEGRFINKNAVTLVPEAEEKLIFPIYNFYLFYTNKKREMATKKLKCILKDLKIINYYTLNIDYEGKSEKVIFPFAIYLVLNIFKSSEIKTFQEYLNIFDVDNDFNDETQLEEYALCEITKKLLIFDTMEIGNAENLQNMISNGWFLKKIHRGSQSSSSLLITDEEILGEITSFEGGNSAIYTSVITPRIQPLWKATSKKLKYFLSGNDFWDVGSEWFFEKVEFVNRESTVNFRIYYGYDILFSLYNYFCRGIDYFPTLDIVAQIPGNPNKTIILLGFLEWDRHTFPNINLIFNNENPFTVFFREKNSFKTEPSSNINIMQKHGIEYSLFEITLERDTQPIIQRLILEEDNSLSLVPTADEIGASFKDFFIQNHEYLEELCYIVSSFLHFES